MGRSLRPDLFQQSSATHLAAPAHPAINPQSRRPSISSRCSSAPSPCLAATRSS